MVSFLGWEAAGAETDWQLSDRRIDVCAGGVDVTGRVHAAEELLGDVGAADLLVRVPGSKGRLEPGGALLVEPLCGQEQQLADPVQRVLLASPVLDMRVI